MKEISIPLEGRILTEQAAEIASELSVFRITHVRGVRWSEATRDRVLRNERGFDFSAFRFGDVAVIEGEIKCGSGKAVWSVVWLVQEIDSDRLRVSIHDSPARAMATNREPKPKKISTRTPRSKDVERLGRPPKLTDDVRSTIVQWASEGISIAETARRLEIGETTVKRARRTNVIS